MKKVFNVKNESIYIFMRENIVGMDSDRVPNRLLDKSEFGKTEYGIRDSGNNYVSPYNLMKDELPLKSESELGVGSVLGVSLVDVASNSGTALSYKYLYEIVEYDDVCKKAVLKDFKVTIVNVIKPKIY